LFSRAGTTPALYNLCGSGTLGVDLSQLIIAPAGHEGQQEHSSGYRRDGYQRFRRKVCGLFGLLSDQTKRPTTAMQRNRFGVRFGWMGKITDSSRSVQPIPPRSA
jgi:hypothetical protein